MASIAQFLLSLNQNQQQGAAFRASPQAARAAMTSAGLSNDQQQIILSKDPAKIAAAVQAELSTGAQASADHLNVPISLCFAPPAGP